MHNFSNKTVVRILEVSFSVYINIHFLLIFIFQNDIIIRFSKVLESYSFSLLPGNLRVMDTYS